MTMYFELLVFTCSFKTDTKSDNTFCSCSITTCKLNVFISIYYILYTITCAFVYVILYNLAALPCIAA